MLSKSQEKYVKGLHQLKNRRQSAAFFFEGHKMSMDGFAEANLTIQSVFALDSWVAAYAKELEVSLAQKIVTISEREMKKISALKTPTPVLVVAKQPAISPSILLEGEGLKAIYLEDIQNPGNMGTILRVADWFGITQVIASPNSVDFFNPKVIQASMSSIFKVRMSVMDLEELAQNRRDAKILATAMNGVVVQDVDSQGDALILMIGNEGKGLSQKAFDLADKLITIPGDPSRKAESLNAAMATGIICGFLTL